MFYSRKDDVNLILNLINELCTNHL